jgi:hypothetical protein
VPITEAVAAWSSVWYGAAVLFTCEELCASSAHTTTCAEVLCSVGTQLLYVAISTAFD